MEEMPHRPSSSAARTIVGISRTRAWYRSASRPRWRSRTRWFEMFDAVASSLTLGRRAVTVGPGSAVAWLPSSCLVARATSLGSGFDESLRVGEDVDLV